MWRWPARDLSSLTGRLLAPMHQRVPEIDRGISPDPDALPLLAGEALDVVLGREEEGVEHPLHGGERPLDGIRPPVVPPVRLLGVDHLYRYQRRRKAVSPQNPPPPET